MPHYVYVIFCYSILVAAGIGGVRFKKIDPAFYPFVYLTWIASANEIISTIFTAYKISTSYNNNIYVLAEILLLVWQIKKWNGFGQNKWIAKTIWASFIALWIITLFLNKGIFTLQLGFRMAVAVAVLLLYINYSNRLIFQYDKPTLRHPAFLISIGLVFFFAFKLLIEIYWCFGISHSDQFLYGLFTVIAFINLFVNLLFSIAALWIPTKPEFITFSSFQ